MYVRAEYTDYIDRGLLLVYGATVFPPRKEGKGVTVTNEIKHF